MGIPQTVVSVYMQDMWVTMSMQNALLLNTIPISQTSFMSNFIPLSCK